MRQLIVERKQQQDQQTEQSSWGERRQHSVSNVARSSGEFPKRRPWHMRQQRPQLTTGVPAGGLPKRRPWFQRRERHLPAAGTPSKKVRHDVTEAVPSQSNDSMLRATDDSPKRLNRYMGEENYHEPDAHMIYKPTLPTPDI